MKNTLALSLLSTALLSTTLLSLEAQAITQKIELDLHGAHFIGQEGIPLKRMIKRQFGPDAIRGFKATKVELKAKSKHGQALASLLVGRNESQAKIIPGTPAAFEDNYSGFSTITLNAPYSYRGDGQGRLRVLVDGNVKVDDIEVTLKKQLRYNHENISGMMLTKMVEFKAQKIIGSTKTIHPRGRVAAIALTGTKGKVRVTKVEITFRDGQQIIVDELNGKLKSGRTKGFTLKGMLQKPITTIKVPAHSTRLFGSRGQLAVKIAQ
jgi:hypothetical protein